MITYRLQRFNGPILDELDSKRLTDVSIASAWPGGHTAFSGKIKRDVLKAFKWQPHDEVLAFDGPTEIYRGEIDSPDLNTTNYEVGFSAYGWSASLNRRQIRRRWQDLNGVLRLDWPQNTSLYNYEAQKHSRIDKRGNLLRYTVSPDDFDFSDYTVGQRAHYEEYRNPPGVPIRRVRFTYEKNTGGGEIVNFRIVDGAGNTQWSDNSAGEVALNTVTANFNPVGSDHFQFVFEPTADIFDQNDYIEISNVVVESEDVFTQAGIVQRALQLGGDFISGDVSLMTQPTGFLISPFLTRNDGYQTVASLIEDVLVFGDSSYNEYKFQVWGTSSSDGLPQAQITKRDTTDYEWVADPRQNGVTANLKKTPIKDIVNWVAVRYVDKRGLIQYLTGDTSALFRDDDSIAAFGRCDDVLDLGESDGALVIFMGINHINRFAWPRTYGDITITGKVKDKNGNERRVSRIKAGQRIRYLPTGENLFISDTKFSVERDQVQIAIDKPPNKLTTLMEQRKAGIQFKIPRVAGFDGS